MENQHDLLTETEAAEKLRVSKKTLQAWRWLRKGPNYVKVGRSVRYLGNDLKSFRDAGRVMLRVCNG
jgi:hypothetical protein